MSSERNPQRHAYLVNRVFQMRFILKIVVAVLLSTMAAAGAFYFLAAGVLSTAGVAAGQQDEDVRALLVPAVTLAALISFTLVSIFSVAIVVRETHRLAGPLVRFQQSIRMMAEGHLGGETHLRKRDELRGLADSINLLSRTLQEGAQGARQALARLRASRDDLARRGLLPAEAASAIDERIAEVESALGHFSP